VSVWCVKIIEICFYGNEIRYIKMGWAEFTAENISYLNCSFRTTCVSAIYLELSELKQ